jgi:thymidylate synthase
MISFDPQFGYSVSGDTIGEAWLTAVECVLKNGIYDPDENRGRHALQMLRLKVRSHGEFDALVERYGNSANIEKMKRLVFESPTMEDFDISPNFRPGAKSYHARLREGRMIDFVVKRLTEIPESKKAVMVFPTYEDYAKVLESPYNDYLPCIVSLQFRLRKSSDGGYTLNTIFFMRSQDIFQKNVSDLIVFSLLAQEIGRKLSRNLNVTVQMGFIDGIITDAHIYQNTNDAALAIVTDHLNNQTYETSKHRDRQQKEIQRTERSHHATLSRHEVTTS